MKIRYRITKYDPVLRDGQGRYLPKHWTSVSDLGNPACTPPLTLPAYLATEAAYVSAIQEGIRQVGCQQLVVTKAEKYVPLAEVKEQLASLGIPLTREEEEVFQSFAVGLPLTAAQVPAAARLILREALWGELASVDGRLTIEFGYDYYLYLTLPPMPPEAIRRIEAMGLHVESNW